MLLLGHLTKFPRQSEGVVLDFRESLPVACVVCLQQRIAQLNDGALVLDPRAARCAGPAATPRRGGRCIADGMMNPQ